ncbi:hypothetical protein OCU04_007958 [Sclerotinia nivalis]|uniref:Uncharacterized protein n=1 Tax=Sclerotinia nivalis TaxID=352851 RepID=A0A9X0AJV9_9HELO|nr:hypothetical protein OCU04_007958 [Sclerotinia nivalis]
MEISQHGTVLTIDKISQYLDVCTYLLHLCRKPKYRPIFSNITLEPLISPPASHPDGAVARHYVHGEVQLILYHEQNPRNPAPRCIGSSKSACFLCDSFIRKHGKFHISHSHKRLYEQWTVPEEPWMTSSCGKKLDNILNDMSCEILDLAETWKRPAKCENDGAESRVHLLMLPKSAKSSGMSLPKISEAASHHSSTENIASFESGTKEDRPKNRKYTLELDDASTTSFDIDEAINPDTIRFSNGLTNYVERSSIKSFTESFLKSSKSALYLPLPTKIEKVEYMVNKTPSNQAQISLIDNTIDLLANNSGINLPRASKSSFRLPLGDGAPIESKAQVSESKHFPVNQMAGQTEALPKVSSEISVPNSSKSSLHLPISNKQATKVEVEPKETESKFPDISDSVLSQSETSSSIKLTRSKTMPKYSPVIPKTQSELSISLKSPFPQPNPTYTLNDLPLNLPIPPHHPKDSIILHLNNVEYIFDILAMKSGHLIIERHEPHEPEAGNELLEERQPYEKKTKKPQSINVRGPELDTEVVISGAESDVNANAIAFSVNDGGDFGICVKIIWEDSGE